MNDVLTYSIINEVNVVVFSVKVDTDISHFYVVLYYKNKCNKKFIIFTKQGHLTGRCRCDIHNVFCPSVDFVIGQSVEY